MEMTEHETKTTAPDSGLRIKTEVKGRNAASPGGTAPDIVCKVVNLAYGDNHVLHDITMDMDDRRVTALIGPSGCGKSTLLRCLNRMNDLIDNVRVWGEIRVKGLDINALSTDVIEVRRRVGMVFQKSNPFPKSIFENVAYGLRINRMAKSRSELSGRTASARAMQSRCCWPPDSASAEASSRSFTSSHSAACRRLSSTRAVRSARLPAMPLIRSP